MLRKEGKSARDVKNFYEEFHARICVKEGTRFNRWMLKILALGSGIKLLDIACGGGYFLSAASQKEIDCYGVDISERAIGIAGAQSGQKKLVVADAEHLPWEDNSFDVVSCLGSLEHFLHPEVALSEMLRVAKPQAQFYILVPNLYAWDNIEIVKRTGRPATHSQELERFATRWQWQDLLQENGLRVKRVQGYNGFPNLFEISKGRFKIKSLRKFFLRFFIPFNLCSSFIFICEKKIR